MSSLKPQLFRAVRRGLIQGVWVAFFLCPLAYFETDGREALGISALFSVLPAVFAVLHVLSDVVLEDLNQRLALRWGYPPAPPNDAPVYRSSDFVAVLILGIGIALFPIMDSIQPRIPGNPKHGAALLAYLLSLIMLLICCSNGQRLRSYREFRYSTVLIVFGVSFLFGYSQWAHGQKEVGLWTGSGMFTAGLLGYCIGLFVTPSLERLADLWEQMRKMGAALGAFLLGYALLVFAFTSFYASAWKLDNASFKGLSSQNPNLGEFLYFSIVTASTLGYGDITPVKPVAKFLASCEVLFGVGWSVVAFAAMAALLGGRPSGTKPDEG